MTFRVIDIVQTQNKPAINAEESQEDVAASLLKANLDELSCFTFQKVGMRFAGPNLSFDRLARFKGLSL